MNKTLSYIATLLIGAGAFLSSCSEDLEQPPVYDPVATLGEANATIADLKQAYWQTEDSYATIVGNLSTVTGRLVDGNKHVIVKGRITTSDQPGNVYQTLVVEDETGAITISTSMTKIYQSYAMGQEAYIDVTGLAIGKYRGLMQLGASNADGSETSRMTEAALKAHVQANGIPEPEKIEPTVVTIDELVAAKSDPEKLMSLQSRTVTVENVAFVEAGEPYAEGTSSTNRYLADENGRRILLRNSGRCDFAGDIMPAGRGNVTAILSYYGSDWQLLLVSPLGLSGDFVPATPPEPLGEANITIADLKAKYWSTDRNYVNTVEYADADASTPYIIEGTVISSDQSGNIYKSIMVKDATAALTIAINSSSLYAKYPMGQTLRINVSDLKLGGYNGLMQLGGEGTYNGAPSMTFMESGEFSQHTDLVGSANPSAVVPVVTTLAELNAAKTTPEGLQKWQSQLITLKGVHFTEAGQKFAPGQTTNRTVADAEGNTIILRNSSYASFANDALPAGTGDLTAILSYFGTDWQLLLIDLDGLKNFDGTTPDTPVPGGSSIWEESFANGQGAFTIDNVLLPSELTYIWTADSYGYMKASAYKGQSYASESWLISPEIDLTGATGCAVDFEHATNKFPDVAFVKANCTLWVREAGTTAWTQLTIPNYSDNTSWTFLQAGPISLAAFDGKKIQLGFKYTSEVDKSGTWEVKNIKVTGNK